MPPAGRIEAAERAERAAAGPSWSQGRGASDAVRLSTRFFIPFGYIYKFYNVRAYLR